MLIKDLQKGKEYLYSAGDEAVKVVYLRETFNGYVFEAKGVKRELSIVSVKLFIKETE